MKRGPKPKPVADRFWPKVQKGDICWLWTGGTSGPYGSFRIDGRAQTAHHVAHELMIGPVPPKFHVDHLCRNPLCVNPDHLEAVPASVNVRRAPKCTKPTCPQGHPYDGVNNRGTRTCSRCARERYQRKPCRRCGGPKEAGETKHMCGACEQETGQTRWLHAKVERFIKEQG